MLVCYHYFFFLKQCKLKLNDISGFTAFSSICLTRRRACTRENTDCPEVLVPLCLGMFCADPVERPHGLSVSCFLP